MKEVNWFVYDGDIPIQSHKLIYKGNKTMERSYIILDTNEYIRMI